VSDVKQWIGALVLAGALAVPLAGETDGASIAQQAKLVARLTPGYVTAGDPVTVTSVDPCPQAMKVFWSLGPGSLSGSISTGADGRWFVRFDAPEGAGMSPFFAHCAFDAKGNAIAMYEQLDFTIVARRPPQYTG
jgi:hypothetical protein